MFAKLNNGKLIFAPECIICSIKVNGKTRCYTVFNPTEEEYLNSGYFPVVLSHPESYNEASFYKRNFFLKDNTIYGEWVECSFEEALEYEAIEARLSGGAL